MTVKNTLDLLDYYSEKKSKMKNVLLDRNMSWNHGDVSLYSLSEQLAENIETDLVFLRVIKKQITPNCNHPKKWHDVDPAGNRYCMDCNLVL